MHPKTFKGLLKECVMEVLMENLGETSKCPECGTPDRKCNCKVVARVKAYSALKKKVDAGNASPEEVELVARERPWVQSILRQAGYGVQGGMYMREGFEPTSMGPNIPEENPYPAWNAMMRQLEENEHGRYAQEAGAGQFDPRTFGVNEEAGEPELYQSHGVTYGHIEKGLKCPPDMTTFSYTLNHVPSGKKFPRQICCYNSNDFYRLMRHWSLSNDWTCEPADQTLQ